MTKIATFIGGHEGFVSNWYLDPVHVPTIGFGFTWGSKVFRDWWTLKHGRKMKKGDTISKPDALAVLAMLIEAEYGPPVEAKFAGLARHVIDAGKSMVYNCGPGALKWKWAAAIASGKIAEGCRLWRGTGTTARGKRLPGLVRRRNEEATIAEFDRWPAWVIEAKAEVPDRVTDEDDIRTAQQWLRDLGYYQGEPDGIAGGRTITATRMFQTDHGSLRVDGIIGPATLSALQRAIDLKAKAGKTTAGGGAVAGGGVVEKTTDVSETVPADADLSWLGDALLWGGVAIVVLGLVWLAWRYRDELKAAAKKV